MAVKRIKVKAGEDLSPANIKKAIKHLEDGATKKVACQILGIAYNTSRLATIIEGYHERVEFDKTQKAKKRGKPIEGSELASIIEQYLTCGSMEAVAKSHFRSTALIRATLDKYGALLKSPKTDYFHPAMLPDQCIADTLENGQLVWSSRHNGPAQVRKYHGDGAYLLWVLGPHCQFSSQPIEELGSLRHLEELGVNISRVVEE